MHELNPGTAILSDPCGVAGGSPIKQGNGGEYLETAFAKQGDLGSKTLKPLPTGVAWKAGSVVQTSLFITANHAGGWQFRLCKSSEDLTEECFKRELYIICLPPRNRLTWFALHRHTYSIRRSRTNSRTQGTQHYHQRYYLHHS